MTRTPLTDYLKRPDTSQEKLGRQVNLTQGAISKMVLSGRDIVVIEHDDGTIALEEKRMIGASNAA